MNIADTLRGVGSGNIGARMVLWRYRSVEREDAERAGTDADRGGWDAAPRILPGRHCSIGLRGIGVGPTLAGADDDRQRNATRPLSQPRLFRVAIGAARLGNAANAKLDLRGEGFDADGLNIHPYAFQVGGEQRWRGVLTLDYRVQLLVRVI